VVYAPIGDTEFVRLGSALVVTTQRLSAHRTAPDGKLGGGSFAVTNIWKKLPQGWRIVYGHESWVKPPG
jgi:hypothetical protein